MTDQVPTWAGRVPLEQAPATSVTPAFKHVQSSVEGLGTDARSTREPVHQSPTQP